MSYFHRSVTSNLGNMLTWRQLFRAMFCPFSIQIDKKTNNCLQVSILPKLEVTDLWKYDNMSCIYKLYKSVHSAKTPKNSLKFRNIFRKPFFQFLAVSEIAENGNNYFLKTFLNLSEFYRIYMCVLTQFTTYE